MVCYLSPATHQSLAAWAMTFTYFLTSLRCCGHSWRCCPAEVITPARYGSAGTFINEPQVSEVPKPAIGNHIWLELCSVSKLSAHLPLPKRFRRGSKQSLFCWGLRALRQRKQTQAGWANLLCAELGLTAPSWLMPVGFLSLLWLKQGVWGCSFSPVCGAGSWHSSRCCYSPVAPLN